MTDQTYCREFTAAEVEVEAAYIGQFHSEQAARTRDMLEAYARILRNTRAQSATPEGFEKELRDFLLKEMPPGTVIGSPVYWAKRIAGRVHLLTRSNAKAGEVVWVCSNPKCNAVHHRDPMGHCWVCLKLDGMGFSTMRKTII